jgi:hypothetical protein
MKGSIALRLLLSFALLLPTAALADSIVVDGSFELNLTTNRFVTIVADQTIGAWRVDSGSVDFIQSYWPAADGSNSVDLNGWSRGSIYQDLSTTPGDEYIVSFFVSGNPDAPGVKPLQFWWNGTLIADNIASDANTWQTFHYTQFVFPGLVATGPSTRIQFASTTQGVWGPVLDDVSADPATPITPVPEPASLVLLGTGLSLLVPRLRRRLGTTRANETL